MPQLPQLTSALGGAVLIVAPLALAGPGDRDALQPRSIGPAGMSGRVASVAGVPGDPRTLWVGAATGGLWHSEDGGLSWTPRYDHGTSSSIGAIALWPTDSDVVWIGTGEGNPRNSSSVGTGMARSVDGGRTWKHLGLADSEKIHRILLDPRDQDVAWVGVLGPTWSDGVERGVYRTTDAGETWERTLFVDERTGCSDLVADPRNPEHMLAGMWSHRRSPDFFTSGGEGSGLWVTHDGGDHWTQLTPDDGLPAGELGRIGLAWSESHPHVVYALVEAEQPVLLRSDDGGSSWRTVNSDDSVAPRPFYFCDIRVDPGDPDRVYSLHTIVTVSEDGGASFEEFVPYNLVHPDHHALWIDPTDPNRMVNGNDGGIALSIDRGESWRFVRNLPLAQYYHVSVDMDVPYNVYGGMQDNGSWRGPSSVWENGGIRNHHWSEVGFGDGFGCVTLPGSTTRGYGMSQGGSLYRWNDVTGERAAIRPDGPEGVELRFAWNAGLALDPFDPNALFYGSQFVHLSRDMGHTWTTISPDLTTDEPRWQRQAESGGLSRDVTAAENHCTILTIAPSELEQGLLWVGTDDGQLWRGTANGEWEPLHGKLEGVALNTWIAHVEASRHDAARAYVVLDGHRRGDREPHLYRTNDGGATFQRLDLQGVIGHAHTLEEDPVDPDLLFLGTEAGLWLSQDGGAHWEAWGEGFPTVPVRSLVVHPRDHDLVVGTHGRAAWVIDDIRPLRGRSSEDRARIVDVVPPAPTIAHLVKQTRESRFAGTEEFRGQNRRRGALISFHLVEPEGGFEGKGQLDVLSEAGEVLRRTTFEPTAGLHRIVWDLRRHGERGARTTGRLVELPGGPEVVAGRYRVRVTVGDHEDEARLDVLPDPRLESGLEDLRARHDLLARHGALSARLDAALARADRIAEDLEWIQARAKQAKDPEAEEGAPHPHQVLLDAVDAFREQLDALVDRVREPRDLRGIHESNRIEDRLGRIRWYVGSSHREPRPAEVAQLERVEAECDAFLAELERLMADPLEALRDQAADAGVTPLVTGSGG